MACEPVRTLRATKCVTQFYEDGGLHDLLSECLTITYNAIDYGRKNGIDNRKGMKDFYCSLKGVILPSCYKLAAITRGCAVPRSRKKSEKRGIDTRNKKPLKPMICVISGFFITMKGRLFVPRVERSISMSSSTTTFTRYSRKGGEKPDDNTRQALILFFGGNQPASS